MVANSTGIDFLKIHPIGGDRRFAFEELCCQLASDEPYDSRVSFYRKGLGGDGGVECYATLADGEEIGWQAKYFPTFGFTQAKNLTESLENALVKHPNLIRYIVCLPINLKDSRAVGKGGQTVKTELMRWQEWREARLAAVEAGRTLSIELWDESTLLSRLTGNDSKTAGRRAFFFGDLHLTPEWFREKFHRTKASLQQRYTPDHDVELPIRKVFWGLARTEALREVREQFAARLARWNWIHRPDPSIVSTELAQKIDDGIRRIASSMSMRIPASEALPSLVVLAHHILVTNCAKHAQLIRFA